MVAIKSCLRSTECDDTGLYVDGPVEWLDLIGDPQYGAIDFSDMSLYFEQHAENNDALSPLSTSEALSLSTETLDYFWASPTDTIVNDDSFEKLTNGSMQSFLSNHDFPVSNSQLPSQQNMVLNMLETPSSAATKGGLGLSVPTISPFTMVLPPELTQKEQKAWDYYQDIIFPSMFPFLPLGSAQDECKNAIKACQNSASFLRQIVFQTERYQASELRRFGLSNTKDHVSGQDCAQPMLLQRYGVFDMGCILHILMAQESNYTILNSATLQMLTR